MPNWSSNRITLYEDFQLVGDDFYNDKEVTEVYYDE